MTTLPDDIARANSMLDDGGPYLFGIVFRSVIDGLVQARSWATRLSPQGYPFRSFGEFAAAARPHGLGVRDECSYRSLASALESTGHYAEFTELIEVSSRPRGRPSKNLADSENFPFHTRRTSGVEFVLPRLKRHHPHFFAAVCDLQISPHAAAIEAGLINPPRAKVVNVEVAADLDADLQAEAAAKLWSAMQPEAQARFIRGVLEPRLGPGLADRWRIPDQGTME
jgi:hypothetical protein